MKLLCNIALLVVFVSHHVESFSIVTTTKKNYCHYQRLASTKCWARKQPPAVGMDLKALEEYEKKLETMHYIGRRRKKREDGNHLDGPNVESYTIHEDLAGMRLDMALPALEPKLSRSYCGNLISDGRVHIVVGSGRTKVMERKAFKVECGMQLRVEFPEDREPPEIEPENIPLDILYEDEHMIVINKDADMVVHPAAGHWDGTVVNALSYYLANNSTFGSGDFVGSDGSIHIDVAEGIAVEGTDGEAVSYRPGIVHRLDKGSSGVLVVAKTRAALAALSSAFKAREVAKTYLAVTVGNPGRHVVIDKPIGRHPRNRQQMRVVPDPHNIDRKRQAPKDRLFMTDKRPPSVIGRQAISHVDTLTFDGQLSFVKVRIETGRTHQIRVHLQDRHTPVYGDTVYGLPDWNKRLAKTHAIERPLLHAYTLGLNHPITGEAMEFRAPLPDDMRIMASKIWPNGKEECPDIFMNTTIVTTTNTNYENQSP